MCLSKTYVSTYTKFRWRCAEGHEWKAKPIGVKAGNWCPACVGRPQLTIEDMQVRAKERGGVCLFNGICQCSHKTAVALYRGARVAGGAAQHQKWEMVPSVL